MPPVPFSSSTLPRSCQVTATLAMWPDPTARLLISSASTVCSTSSASRAGSVRTMPEWLRPHSRKSPPRPTAREAQGPSHPSAPRRALRRRQAHGHPGRHGNRDGLEARGEVPTEDGERGIRRRGQRARQWRHRLRLSGVGGAPATARRRDPHGRRSGSRACIDHPEARAHDRAG